MSGDEPATRSDFAELSGEIRALCQTVLAIVPDVRHMPAQAGGDAKIVIHAGGVALWVAATCCAVMLAVMIPMALGLYWVAMDSRDRGHQMNALYQSTPGLRELVQRQMSLNDQTRQDEPQKPK